MARNTSAFLSCVGGRVHGDQGQDLQQVVLHHVAQRADGVVEAAAALDAEVLVLLRIMCERSARIFLDVSGVSFMDCAGLRALLTTGRRAELRGGCMRLIATSAAVRRIIELTGAHEALAVEREARSVRSNSFLPNGPDATRRQKCRGGGG
jgi:anti-anti-sigma factor